MKLKKCVKCGAVVEVIEDCSCSNCGIKCCEQEMVVVKENSTDAYLEKHLPQIEVCGNYILATVNHVMDDDHYIEWIAMEGGDIIGKKFFHPGQEAKAIFPYVKGGVVYAYCNKHGVWSKVIE